MYPLFETLREKLQSIMRRQHHSSCPPNPYALPFTEYDSSELEDLIEMILEELRSRPLA